jgi:hypothetical protein
VSHDLLRDSVVVSVVFHPLYASSCDDDESNRANAYVLFHRHLFPVYVLLILSSAHLGAISPDCMTRLAAMADTPLVVAQIPKNQLKNSTRSAPMIEIDSRHHICLVSSQLFRLPSNAIQDLRSGYPSSLRAVCAVEHV